MMTPETANTATARPAINRTFAAVDHPLEGSFETTAPRRGSAGAAAWVGPPDHTGSLVATAAIDVEDSPGPRP